MSVKINCDVCEKKISENEAEKGLFSIDISSYGLKVVENPDDGILDGNCHICQHCQEIISSNYMSKIKIKNN